MEHEEGLSVKFGGDELSPRPLPGGGSPWSIM